MQSAEKIKVLIVDDRQDKLLAIEAVLAAIDVEVVCARSGREALRQLLQTEFAVILLDINMPEMDGFETATLIRQRGKYKHTPIIFLTAADDELHVLRSYSLGAVDYILTPVQAEVLRAKVGVFVELAKKSREIELQAESLHRKATQLQKLASASVTINSAPLPLEAKLSTMAETARDIIGAHQAIVTVSFKATRQRRTSQHITWSFSDEYTAWNECGPEAEAWRSLRILKEGDSVVRLTEAELEHRLDELGVPGRMQIDGHLPWRGSLATALVDASGVRIGILEVSHKAEGEFSEDDAAILVQLAQLGSVALQNWINEGTREANRIKDEFLGILSHELRNPLHAILGWTQHLRVELEGKGDSIGHGLDVIERNVKAQAALVEDLLDVSRINSGKLHIEKQILSLRTVINEAVDACRPQAEGKDLTLNVLLGDCNNPINGDPNRLRQVMSNLLSNAIKFTPNGGQITVEVAEDHGQIEVRVADTGEGISAEFLPFVFERFRQGETSGGKAQPGLGLGLAIVRHIVELHGGQVDVESPGVGQGATFVVKIPRTEVETKDERDAPSRISSSQSTQNLSFR